MEHGCFRGCEKPLQDSFEGVYCVSEGFPSSLPILYKFLILREEISFNVSKVFVFNLTEILVIV